MSNFQINFTLPWLLLLLIPAVLLGFIPYFRLSKKYRRTRNRIISLVLYLAVMVMSISVLAGMTFSYDVPNRDNEIILLVDASFSGGDKETERDRFVKELIDGSNGLYRIGIVKFGFDQVLAAELSNDMEEVYNQYLNSPEVDDSATDIESAIRFAVSQFTNKSTAKIVLVSDCAETDGNALSAVRTAVAETNVKFDVFYLPNPEFPEIQIIGTGFPEYIPVGEEFPLSVSVQSREKATAILTVTDMNETGENNEPKSTEIPVTINEGITNLNISYAFEFSELHEMRISIKPDSEGDDHSAFNNTYYSYVYLNEFNKILLLEGYAGEGEILEGYLTNAKQYGGSTNYRVERICVREHPENVPRTMDELRDNFDQVLLLNISNADLEYAVPGTENKMPENFASMLNEYVNVYGGGVFAVGGNEPGTTDSESPQAHSFNRADYDEAERNGNTALADMLPVQVEEYTPPMAVMIIIDRSGSMNSAVGGTTRLEIAKSGAQAAVDELKYRDYIGITTLEDGYNMNVSLISAINKRQINSVIDAIEVGGGTTFSNAIDAAGTALANFSQAEVKHMILITDGVPSDSLEGSQGYGQYIRRNFSNGITLSIIQISDVDSNDMKRAANDYGHGDSNANGYIRIANRDITGLGAKIREAIGDARVEEVTYEPYTPRVVLRNSIVRNVDEKTMPQLGGFFGTREKVETETVLMAQYVPLYTQWTYGEGRVGAFMCSLSGDSWSADFLDSSTGRTLIYNIISTIMPTFDISTKKITATIDEKNYSNTLSVFTDLEEKETIEIEVKRAGEKEGEKYNVEVAEMYKRASFYITQPGVYEITVRKLNENGEGFVDENGDPDTDKYYTMYKSFAYSAEYNVFIDAEATERLAATIAENGRGLSLREANEVFLGIDTVFHKTYDPKVLFIILSIIFFLLDIAVRKFKFKWPHEIVRDYKEKKRFKQGKK